MAKPNHTPPAAVNQGIITNSLTAEVVSVGHQASATKYVNKAEVTQELRSQVADLHAALATLQLPTQQRQAMAADIDALAATPEPEPRVAVTRLNSLNDRLRAVGVVLKDAAELAAPVTKIAEALRIPLHLIGLG